MFCDGVRDVVEGVRGERDVVDDRTEPVRERRVVGVRDGNTGVGERVRVRRALVPEDVHAGSCDDRGCGAREEFVVGSYRDRERVVRVDGTAEVVLPAPGDVRGRQQCGVVVLDVGLAEIGGVTAWFVTRRSVTA